MTVYRGDGWEVREGRWQDSAPESVDVVISDPPFTDHISSNQSRVSGAFGPGPIPKEALSFGGLDVTTIAKPMVRIARRWCVLFCAVEQLGAYQQELGREYIRGCIWIKPNATPQFSGDRPAAFGEAIAVLHRRGHGRLRWNGGGHAGRFVHYGLSGAMGRDRVHETQKPIALMLELVSLFSEPGELVWDPYCGSGTTGVASLRLGRRFLGHEMQPHYAKVATERLAAEERGLSLRDVRAGQTSILDLEGMDDGA